MKYLKYFESGEYRVFTKEELQGEFRKDVPDTLYDVWDVCIDWSDDYEDLKFEICYGGGRFPFPILMGEEFYVDFSNDTEVVKLTQTLLNTIFNNDNLRYDISFNIKWSKPFDGCDKIMEKLAESVKFRGLDVRVKKPKTIAYRYAPSYLSIQSSN
jgi:hypothetical protein